MIEKSVEERVKNVVIEVLKVDPSRLLKGSRFIEDLGADSLDRVSLIMALEDEFKGSIGDEDAIKLTTVGEAIEFIETKMPHDA